MWIIHCLRLLNTRPKLCFPFVRHGPVAFHGPIFQGYPYYLGRRPQILEGDSIERLAVWWTQCVLVSIDFVVPFFLPRCYLNYWWLSSIRSANIDSIFLTFIFDCYLHILPHTVLMYKQVAWTLIFMLLLAFCCLHDIPSLYISICLERFPMTRENFDSISFTNLQIEGFLLIWFV